jgi:hypothetical protein
MMPDRNPAPVTLEDLLRVKRAERPEAAFWSEFERDLRAKQLAAIVEKRPWWYAPSWVKLRAVGTRLQVPVGVAAVLMLSLVAVREYRPSVGGDAVPVAVARETVVRATYAATPVQRVEPVGQIPAVQASVEDGAQPVAAVAEVRPVTLTEMIPWGTRLETEATALTASARVISDALATLQPVNLKLVPLLGERGEATELDAVKPARAVAAVNSPRDLRRTRLLASLDNAATVESPDGTRAARVRERITSGLSQEQLYDSVRRVGMDGNRLTLKF